MPDSSCHESYGTRQPGRTRILAQPLTRNPGYDPLIRPAGLEIRPMATKSLGLAFLAMISHAP
jgi:hypothetical protein